MQSNTVGTDTLNGHAIHIPARFLYNKNIPKRAHTHAHIHTYKAGDASRLDMPQDPNSQFFRVLIEI